MSDILPEGRDAYALLSKPTLQLTDEELTIVCTELRAKRLAFLDGVKDAAPKTRKKAEPISPEAKAAATKDIEDLLGDISI